MSFRTILVPVEQHDLMSSTLETALCLAQKFDSYIEGFVLRVANPAAYAMADATPVTIPNLEHDIAENAKQTRGFFESFMQEHGVPCGAHTAALSSKWLEDAPEGDDFVGSHGRLFDVIVLGRPGHNPKGSRMGALEAALFESGRPVLVAPPLPRPQMGTNALVAWNCSTEQRRAFHAVLRLEDPIALLLVDGVRSSDVLDMIAERECFTRIQRSRGGCTPTRA
jgi:hypothetical protein